MTVSSFLSVMEQAGLTNSSSVSPAELGALTQLEDYESVRHITDIYEYYVAMQDLMIQYGTGGAYISLCCLQ